MKIHIEKCSYCKPRYKQLDPQIANKVLDNKIKIVYEEQRVKSEEENKEDDYSLFVQGYKQLIQMYREEIKDYSYCFVLCDEIVACFFRAKLSQKK